jgi:hypothetical protein
MFWRRALTLAVTAAALAVPVARADGDPASDYLYQTDVFVPAGTASKENAAALDAIVLEARKRGYPVKVALIGSMYDLGAVTPLWRQPQRYAEFLGQELSFAYRGTLLVVMPNGYGVFHRRQPVATERRALGRLTTPAAAKLDLAAAAGNAIRTLATARGITLSPPSRVTTPNRNSDRWKIAAVAAAVALLIAAFEGGRRVRARRSGPR